MRSLREPSFRTARQRALAGGDDDEDGLEMLEFRRKNVEKEMTEEERAVKAQKRKELVAHLQNAGQEVMHVSARMRKCARRRFGCARDERIGRS